MPFGSSYSPRSRMFGGLVDELGRSIGGQKGTFQGGFDFGNPGYSTAVTSASNPAGVPAGWTYYPGTGYLPPGMTPSSLGFMVPPGETIGGVTGSFGGGGGGGTDFENFAPQIFGGGGGGGGGGGLTSTSTTRNLDALSGLFDKPLTEWTSQDISNARRYLASAIRMKELDTEAGKYWESLIATNEDYLAERVTGQYDTSFWGPLLGIDPGKLAKMSFNEVDVLIGDYLQRQQVVAGEIARADTETRKRQELLQQMIKARQPFLGLSQFQSAFGGGFSPESLGGLDPDAFRLMVEQILEMQDEQRAQTLSAESRGRVARGVLPFLSARFNEAQLSDLPQDIISILLQDEMARRRRSGPFAAPRSFLSPFRQPVESTF